MRCAVGKCKQSSSRKPSVNSDEKHVPFYRFPKEEHKRQLWIMFCNRGKPINAQNERICALHFKQEDFERNMAFEMGFSNRRTPKLKPGAVPTIENPISADNEYNLQRHIKILEKKIDVLRRETDSLRKLQCQSAMKTKNLSLEVQNLSRVSGKSQIQKLENLKTAVKAKTVLKQISPKQPLCVPQAEGKVFRLQDWTQPQSQPKLCLLLQPMPIFLLVKPLPKLSTHAGVRPVLK